VTSWRGRSWARRRPHAPLAASRDRETPAVSRAVEGGVVVRHPASPLDLAPNHADTPIESAAFRFCSSSQSESKPCFPACTSGRPSALWSRC
jgi:hypothetical protein